MHEILLSVVHMHLKIYVIISEFTFFALIITSVYSTAKYLSLNVVFFGKNQNALTKSAVEKDVILG